MARSKSSKSSSSGGGVFAGIVIGVALAAAAWFLYTRSHDIQNFFAHGSTSTTHEAPATKRLTAGMATAAKDAPFAASEDVFEAGARLYVSGCARCHGNPKHDAREGQAMHPAAAQFWNARHEDTLAHQTAQEVYTAIAEGDLAKGMPAYAGKLSDTEIWQITLLLRSSRLEMPEPVLHILSTSASK